MWKDETYQRAASSSSKSGGIGGIVMMLDAVQERHERVASVK